MMLREVAEVSESCECYLKLHEATEVSEGCERLQGVGRRSRATSRNFCNLKQPSQPHAAFATLCNFIAPRLHGFTYVELLVTLTIIAILFVPVMQLFSHALHASTLSQDLMTATSLARWGMERIKNLNVTKEQLKESGDSVYPPADEDPMEMNEMKWRIRREIIKESDPLEVRVHVFQVKEIRELTKDGKVTGLGYSEEDKPVVTLVTLFENMHWEEIQPID